MIAKIEFSIYYDFCEYVDLVDTEYQEYTYSRAVVVLNEIVKKHPNQTLAIGTHGGAIRSLQCYFDKNL